MLKLQHTILFIFKVYIFCIYASHLNYCEICSNHTLCKYNISGPSSVCFEYDYNALLTESNIKTLINHINHRRNFIALGHSNFLPGAANMKKIVWSQELATSAQRWVDQCDQVLRPGKEDECRDLETTKVGQNIASIMGALSSLNVKSFVDMWFTESLDYQGSVTYYNASRGYKSNRFTQLIWANTEKIGCGKAKFNIKKIKSTIVERLVCNFAPRGNIHGKSVYIIGYAATQCADDMQQDNVFTGLCSRSKKRNQLLLSEKTYTERVLPMTSLATSLLRIRNLFNDSLQKDIDPVYRNVKQIDQDSEPECPHINKKASSTVIHYNFIDAVKRSHSLEKENFWINQRNNSQFYLVNSSQREKGHSKVYYGQDYRNEFDSIRPEILIKDSGRYNNLARTLSTNYKHQCTRNIGSKLFNQPTLERVACNIKKCTRGHKNVAQIVSQPCKDQCWETTLHPQNVCKCYNLQTYLPNSEYGSVNCHIKRCPNILRTLIDPVNSEMKKRNGFLYHDLFSNKITKPHNKKTTILRQEEKQTIYENLQNSDDKNTKFFSKRKENNPNYSDLKRSIPGDDLSLKPFWEVDSYSNKKTPELKSIKYTTLSNKRNKKLIKPKPKATPKSKFKTEHITLKYNNEQKEISKRFTEKYLSFEELMHLRKFSTGNYSGRRLFDIKSDDNEDKKILRNSELSTEKTLEYTANTPYIRMKHCTRKLTCTWTAASLTDSAGNIIPGGAGGAAGNMGSRTPPGYVEGCTRTSTCTRDYMNRNKMATIIIETTTPEFDSGDDDDYCERRSLHRRNSNEKFLVDVGKNDTFPYNKSSLNTSTNIEVRQRKEINVCICCHNNNVRNKRDDYILGKENIINYKRIKRENTKHGNICKNNLLSYGDIYYRVVKRLISTWKKSNLLNSGTECSCNNTSTVHCYNVLLYISIFRVLKNIHKFCFY